MKRIVLAWRGLALNLGLVAAAGAAARFNFLWLTPLLVLAAELYSKPEGKSAKQQIIDNTPRWLGGLALITILSLQPRPGAQVIILAGYLGWLVWNKDSSKRRLSVAGLAQFFVLWALFLAAAIWRWPSMLVIMLAYGSAWALAQWQLEGQRARQVLSLSWALIVAQCSWVFLVWLVNYIVAGGLVLVPQAAVVITALGYCFGGIYQAHAESKLSRGRLAEYLFIGLILIAVVVAGTRWSGAI